MVGFRPIVRRAIHKHGLARTFRAAQIMGRAAKKWLGKRKRQHQLHHMQVDKKPKTVRKSHPDLVHVDASHSGISSDTIRIVRPGSDKHISKKKIGKWMYQQNFGFLTQCSAGTQQVYDGPCVGTIAQLIQDSGAGYQNTQACIGLRNMNPNLANTGSIDISPLSSPPTDCFIVGNFELRGLITNMGAAAAHLDIYVVTPKVIHNVLPGTAWSNSVSQEGFAHAPMVFPGPGTTTGVIGSETFNNYDVKPNDFTLFRKMWKICSVKSVRLEGNSTEEVNLDFKINKLMSYPRLFQLYNAGSGSLYLPGVTYEIMYVLKGVPTIDQTAATHVATTGNPLLSSIWISRSSAHGVPNAADRLSSNYGITSLPSGTLGTKLGQLTATDAPTTSAATQVL